MTYVINEAASENQKRENARRVPENPAARRLHGARALVRNVKPVRTIDMR